MSKKTEVKSKKKNKNSIKKIGKSRLNVLGKARPIKCMSTQKKLKNEISIYNNNHLLYQFQMEANEIDNLIDFYSDKGNN